MRPRRPNGVGPAGMVLSLAVVLAAPATPAAFSDQGRPGDGRLDLTATALTGPEHPNAVDTVEDEVRSGHGPAKVDTTASGSASCDSCAADASALHIVYLDRPTDATLDNVSVAWSQCTGCRATALSVQVVVLRSPMSVHADNRALAVTAACSGCDAAAAAYQLVVVGQRSDRLSPSAREALEQWVAGQAVALRDAPAVAPTALRSEGAGNAATEGLDQLEQMVGDGLGGARTVERDADLRTASPGRPDDIPPTPLSG